LADWLGGRILGEGFWFGDALSGSTMAVAIAIGLIPYQRLTRANWLDQARRIVAVTLIAGIAGAIGGSLGTFLAVAFHLSPLIGWIMIGAGAGAAEGLYERSTAKLQMGLIGGAAGGLIGGFLFEQIFGLISPRSIATGRFFGFVALVLCIRSMFELLNRTLCSAWLTVLDGDRPGRMVLLYRRPVVIGRATSATLRLDGQSPNLVDQDHARITRNAEGRYILEDNHSRQGTWVNQVRIQSLVELKNRDLIRIGPNSIQFHDRRALASPSPVAEPPKVAPAATVPSPMAPKPATAPSIAPRPAPTTQSKPTAFPKPAPTTPTKPSVFPKPGPTAPPLPAAKPTMASKPSTSTPAKPSVAPTRPTPRPEPPKVTKPPTNGQTPATPAAKPSATRGGQTCPDCGRTVIGNRPYCMFCDREC
jgi:pSer/pThr/pTyr-binding forkhead associated (FHA) protein